MSSETARPQAGPDCLGYCRGTPVPVTGVTNATAISAGGAHSCALLSSGHVDCWGLNYSGELGDGTTSDSLVPVQVSGIRS